MSFVDNLPTTIIYEIGMSIIIYENIRRKVSHPGVELPTKYFVDYL